MKKSKIMICILLVCLFLTVTFTACFSSSSSSSEKVYTCGYCGKQMKGSYYDYIDGNYACRSCSKSHRD